MAGFMDSFANMFGNGGALATGTNYTNENANKVDTLTGRGDLEGAKMVEKGSILNMTPSTFASVAGQLGAAISPKDSWQAKLGGMASQMGSQKLGQMFQAEKEKRSTDLFKQMLGIMSNKDLTKSESGVSGVNLASTGIKPLSLTTDMSLNYDKSLK